MKRILFLVVTLTLLSIATAFSASNSEDSSSNATPAQNKEDSSFAVSSDYFSAPDDADEDSAPRDKAGDRSSYRRTSTSREGDSVDETIEGGFAKDSKGQGEDLTETTGREERDFFDPSTGKEERQTVDGTLRKERESIRDDKDKKDKTEKKQTKEKKKTVKAPVKKTGRPVQEPSALEQAMGENPLIIDKSRPQPYGWDQLTQFGYSFFKRGKDPLAAQTDVPVGPDYLVGPGDRLVVTLWGSINGTYKLDVNRSGEIVLPKVGAVKVAGISYGELPAVLKASVARIYKDFQLNVNLDKLRMIKVYVVGEVAAPGDYNVTSLSTVISALSAAGGPSKNGSLRNIQINRNGKVVETVDLYDFFLKGDKGKDIRLQPGDTILVPVIGRVAGIVGNVKRPGIYELKGDSSLKDLFALGGGVNPTGYLQRVQLYRVEAHDKKIVNDFNLDLSGAAADQQTSSIKMQDLDLVNVLPIDSVLRGYVRLEGHVLRPGDYALKPGMKVSTLLQGDNLLPQYHGGAAQIIRLYPPDLHPEIVYFDVTAALKGEPAQDVELKEFDRVKIFSREQMEETPVVKVSGEVQKPGLVRYLDNMTVRDLLMQVGNVKLSAYLGSAEITRIKRGGGSVTSYSITVNLEQALKGGEENIKLEPFDELTVRRIPNWAEATERYVTLKGEVMFPGTYPIYKGERLSSVIARAGGFTDLAYLKGVRFTRENVRKLQQQRMDEALDRAQDQIIKLQSNVSQTAASAEEVASSKTTLDNLMRSIEILKAKKAEGRVLMEITSLRDLKGSMYDLELQGGDQLTVPSDPGGVNVIGDVYNQSTVVTQRGRDIDWYLHQVGGATGDADLDGIYVVRVDGSVISQANSSKFMFYNSFWGKKLDSGDTIIVPRQYEKTAWLRGAKDIASVIGNIAVTAGVLVAAGL
ncbi:SLBB domain-containing protein [Geomonas paludis]|uniref:Sugar ABC transporter substrate-binding protein n=1 Tax=Geomonas paludis TaxID=2740185 RepID=A0A6V8MX81_9BACT|nr:SLBB domain-containing protein [Geomonas paludis]GFO63849.1 sugar ABC transporter substrate-binding protein [Geomonas paludis]